MPDACKSHITRIDRQIDKLHTLRGPSPLSSLPELFSASDEPPSDADGPDNTPDLDRILRLQVAISAFSTGSFARATVDSVAIVSVLEEAKLLGPSGGDIAETRATSVQAQELEWIVASKATVQTYGLILNLLLDQTIPLNSDIGYWNEILGSYQYLSLYSVQTSPLRLWAWSQNIYSDAWGKFHMMRSNVESKEKLQLSSLSKSWRQFYGLVKESIRDRSLADMQSKVLSPISRNQIEASSKRKHLKRLREMSASGLGILMDEGLMFDTSEEESVGSGDRSSSKDEWKSIVVKSVSLMETVLSNITSLELGISEMEEAVFESVDDDSDSAHQDIGSTQAVQLAARLEHILKVHIPTHIAVTGRLSQEYGRPSRLIRFWLPGLALVLSSSTLLRIVVNRKAEITTWIRDLGATTIDFCNNWILEPVRKIIGTIRHDKDSEIALMSKESLQGDKASLERMVVEFAVDNPNTSTGTPLTDTDIAKVKAKVREGDLTSVLVAYEKDLRKPFIGTVRGDLIRALLIQIQKTKVDVEVALGGIDNLLRSQELVFGFVGLTPGVLVCFGVLRWLNSFAAGRKGRLQGRKHGSMVRILRNIDRILVDSTPSDNGMLSYKDHGMLLCEVHLLRQRARRILPGEIYNDFLEEMDDLVNLHTGVERQIIVVGRVRWAYSKWLW